MIFGDPYYFGIWFDKVKAWSLPNNYYNNKEGIFAIFINGEMLPSKLPDKSTFLDNSLRSINSFFKIIDDLEDEYLFNMPMEDRFYFIINTVNYKNKNLSDEDSFLYWKYCLTDYIDSPSDKNDIWYFSYKEKEKLMYFHQENLKEIELKKGTVKAVLQELLSFNKISKCSKP
ncbi:immunity 42 family protein [Neisseria leonii]|uniref:Immunity 42 family protein n=1 Tax=Neisseria leonii TaxID=2995413 RepID=A0A9X4E4Z5_9NEIS|nr:immunity 42 family protein [Neisseria sp. 51.81]MDD9328804.1 immunity 42 family protein [Neisseria sp. 51.81]